MINLLYVKSSYAVAVIFLVLLSNRAIYDEDVSDIQCRLYQCAHQLPWRSELFASSLKSSITTHKHLNIF